MVQPVHVLIVDDEILSLEILCDLLESMGHSVEIATSGPEALGKISPKMDLVLLDVSMPGMDGFEVAREIRKLKDISNVTIFMVTAMGSEEGRQRAIESGVDDFISKPIDVFELEEQIKTISSKKKI